MYDELVGNVGSIGDYGGRRNIHMVPSPCFDHDPESEQPRCARDHHPPSPTNPTLSLTAPLSAAQTTRIPL